MIARAGVRSQNVDEIRSHPHTACEHDKLIEARTD